jgi:GT2 family glycosyltransferase
MADSGIPVSAVVPTRNRTVVLRRTLESLALQPTQPREIVVTDASDDFDTRDLLAERIAGLESHVIWQEAGQAGAAIQRDKGATAATQPFVWFFDDDILFEPECVSRLWRAIQSDATLGGVSAMIVNQRYQRLGALSRALFTLLHGQNHETFAGRVIGPAVNLLPEDRDDLPDIVPVEWLNTTCTIYRRNALPSPAFDSIFTGYSMMEDVALSLRVRRQWRLANARTARIFHDSQPSAHKADVSAIAAMELANRHYVMKEILGRDRLMDYLRLFVWEIFQLAVCVAHSQSRPTFPAMWRGKWRAVWKLILHKTHTE